MTSYSNVTVEDPLETVKRRTSAVTSHYGNTLLTYLLAVIDTARRTSTVTSHYGNTLLTYLLTVVDTARRASTVASHYGNTLVTYLLWFTLHGGPVR